MTSLDASGAQLAHHGRSHLRHSAWVKSGQVGIAPGFKIEGFLKLLIELDGPALADDGSNVGRVRAKGAEASKEHGTRV